MMVEFVMLVMGIALFFYTVLGGADFGAGIIEMLTGERSIQTISKAIAPVWEANHVWLILVLVVIFNGFPEVFSTMSIMLHIPLLLVLVGMIFRGTAFTFRHYDVIEDSSHRYYHICFRLSSLLTPFFLGMTLGAVILGRISPDLDAGFYAVFIAPWLNVFCIGMGLFTTLLFSYVSAVFLIGEVETEEGRQIMITYSKRSLIALMLFGIVIMALAQWSGLDLLHQFLNQPISLATIVLATLLIPLIFRAVDRRQINAMRLLVGGQVAVIFIGWAAVQFPDFIRFNDGTALTIYNTAAGEATFRQLVIALTVGVLLVLPAFFYLFKVFKQKA